MRTGIGRFLPWENGNKMSKMGLGYKVWNHFQSRHHLFPGVKKRQKIANAPCSSQFLTFLSRFPPNGPDLRSTIFVYSGACKTKSLQGMCICTIQTIWQELRQEQN